MEELKRRGIPLILVSSKTRDEIEVIRQALVNHAPFIVENGGGIFFPLRAFHQSCLEERRESVPLGGFLMVVCERS